MHERLQKVRKKVPATIERVEDLLPLVDDVPVDQKDHFEIETKVFLRRLQEHYEVWSKILAASENRVIPRVRRVK